MNNNKHLILSDADAVLLKWDDAFRAFMSSMGFEQEPNTNHHYSLSKRYKGVSRERMLEYVNEMNQSSWISQLPPVKGAVENVRKLAKLGYKFIVITALSDSSEAAKYRAQNLDDVFGPGIFLHDQMICLAPGSCKAKSLEKWKDSNLFWIEDHPGHAVSGHKLGLRSILLDDMHNQDFDATDFPRVKTWDEIFDIITCEEYESCKSI